MELSQVQSGWPAGLYCSSHVGPVKSRRPRTWTCSARPYMVVLVAQLVARRTHDRKVVGSIPTNAVCFTVVR